ncbi:MAG: universal stress protein [Eubacteriales bacterium]|nr:universal stress protein [Eubacteriales bacterium]
MKILVPVDGSTASCQAAKKSVEIAKNHDSALKLITVIDQDKIVSHRRSEKLWRQVDGSIIAGRAGSIGEDKLTDSLRGNAEELLDSIIEELDLCDIKAEKEVLFGEPYEQILECAEKEQMDLIVMGNRGFSKIKRFFVGSVTQRVISEAPCPVLVIHTDVEN